MLERSAGRNLVRELPKNSAFIALASVWQSLVMYALVPVLLALAGESHYGLWVLLSTLSAMGFFAFLDLGVIGSVVKWVADAEARGDEQSAGRVVNVALFLFALLGLSVAAGLVLARPWLVEVAFQIPESDRAIAQWMILGYAVQLLADFLAMPMAAVAQAFLRFGWLRALESAKVTLFAVVSVACLWSGRGIESLAFVAAGVALLHLPAMAWLARRQLPRWRPRWDFDAALAGKVFRFSAKVFALRITGALYNNMDKLILGVLLGTVAVKDYDIVFKIHLIALLPLSFVTPLIVPLASGMAARADGRGLRELLVAGSKYTGALCVPVAAAVFLLAEPLLTHWLGPQEAKHAGLVRLFVSYLFFWPLIQVGWNSMIGQDRTGPLVAVGLGSVGANLVLSLLLVGPLGIAGVIVATIATNAAAFVAYLRIQLQSAGVALSEYLGEVVVPTFLATALGAGLIVALLALREPSSLLETLLFFAAGTGSSFAAFWFLGIERPLRERLSAEFAWRGSSR